MCNPRRVQITLARDIDEAWSREVRRVVDLTASVTGEARVRQPLDASIGAPVLAALDRAFDQGVTGWEAVEGGFRHAVEGGHVIYSPDDQTLEIVATVSEQIQASGEATEEIGGRLTERVESCQTGQYYDDGWGGHTRQQAEQRAREAAEQALEEGVRQRVDALAVANETQLAETLEATARQRAHEHLMQDAETRRQALSTTAADHLASVGLRARRAFHERLAQAFRDALMALARQRGAHDIRCVEVDGVVEIEFILPD